MKDDCIEERERIELEILAYLYEHPQARDTVEGIAEWWISGRIVRKLSREVKKAIADLVKKGFVIERQISDSRYFYHINSAMKKEIIAWIKQRTNIFTIYT